MNTSPLIQSLMKQEKLNEQRKKIVFAMIEAGEGHKSPALAIKEALEHISNSRYDIVIADFMRDTGCTSLDAFHKKTWNYLLAHPPICKTVHRIADLSGPVFRTLLKIYGASFYEYVLRFLEIYKPNLIFSTHPFNTIAIEHVRKKYGIQVTLINYLTELFDVWSLWVLKGVDYYIVSSEESRKKLIFRGIPENKLFVFDYPIKLDFFNIPSSKEQIGEDLGVDPSKKTLLISFGGQGCWKPDKFIDALAENDVPLNVIVVTGKNKSIHSNLSERYKNYRGNLNLIILGYVNHMNKLIYVADFCFIKPGPSTTMEAVVLKKPILFSKSVHLGENSNISFILKHGLGFYVGDNVKKFLNVIHSFISGSYTDSIHVNYDNIKTNNGSFDIARFIMDIVNGY